MIHGDELEGLLILRDFLARVNHETVRGTLWMIPVVNPLAMEANSRNTPIDSLDLNRQFPGAAHGWLGEQIAHVLTHAVLDKADALIDIHAGGAVPWVDYCYVGNDEGLSRAFLSTLLYRPSKWYEGTSASRAIGRNIPTTVIEIGGGYQDQESHIANGVRGLENMLRYLGVLDGPVVSRTGQVRLEEMLVMRPSMGGLCVPRQSLVPGEWIPGGTALADIVSPYSFEVLETLTAPFERSVVVLARNYQTRIHPGDYTFMMGNGATAVALA